MAVSAVYGALLLALCAYNSAALEEFNGTEHTYLELSIKGKTILMPEELLERLDAEQGVWHWTPWQRTRIEYVDNVARELVSRDSIESFPDSIFTDDQLRSGGFILYAVFGIYAFTLLAVVCNDYFIPCVELICEDLKIPQNVAAATFMSVATSCPEFFVNMISTFLTESDMGIGTIVGSAIFNALGVAALGGLAAIRVAIDSNKRAYSWGFGGFGRLGHAEQKDERVPRLMRFFETQARGVRSVHCGATYSLAVNEHGMLYMFGQTKRTGEANMYPKPVQDLAGWNIRSVGTSNTSILIAADDSLIAWGVSPTYGELGMGEINKSSARPKEVSRMEGFNITQVSMGYSHSMMLCDDSTDEVKQKLANMPVFNP